MDFLTLCKRLRQEARIAGTGPASTDNQTGEAARIVTWINNAWEDIQREHNDWLFMHGEFSADLVIDQTKYTSSLLGISENVRDYDRASFTIYGKANGEADETHVIYLPWKTWKGLYEFGHQTSSRPIHWSLTPDKRVCVGPKPERVYVLAGEYQATVGALVGDAATPSCPEEYHMLIVWWALSKYAASEAAPEVWTYAEQERVKMLAQMELTQLPDMELGGPLA